MSALTSPNQRHPGGPRKCKKAKRINKRHLDCGGSNKILFLGDMIAYLESPKDSTERLLELMSGLSKVYGHRNHIKRIN